jgi:hypothetical protein
MTELEPFADDDAALDADERRMLRAGRRLGVPPGAKRAVWAALATGLPAATAAASAAAASTTAAGVVTTVSLVKYGAIGVLLGVSTMTTVALVRAPSHPPSPGAAQPQASAPVRAKTAPVRPRPVPPTAAFDAPAGMPSVAPAAERPAASPSATVVPAAPPVPAATDTEARRVAAARALTRAGHPRAALDALDALARDIPHGELVQEREALSIEALLMLGERAEARRRATSFLKRFANSPHSAAARRALE